MRGIESTAQTAVRFDRVGHRLSGPVSIRTMNEASFLKSGRSRVSRQVRAWFPLAHGLSSSWQLIRGRSSYWNNHFEVQARTLSSCAAQR